MDSVTRTVHGSSLADVAWIGDDGAIQACGAVVLPWGETPAIAFSFAYADLARSIAAASQVALTFTDTRSTSKTFTPAALIGRPSLVEDLDGDIFTGNLLEQELRRYPPARIFADSFLLRREHWWYLPRLIVRIDVDAARPMPARAGSPLDITGDREYLLAARVDDRIETHLVRVPHGEVSGSIPLTPVEDRQLPSGPAILLGQDASFPDLAQWSSWAYRGTSTGRHFEVTDAPSNLGLGQVPSVWQRMRQQQRFGRACRKGIARAERRLA